MRARNPADPRKGRPELPNLFIKIPNRCATAQGERHLRPVSDANQLTALCNAWRLRRSSAASTHRAATSTE